MTDLTVTFFAFIFILFRTQEYLVLVLLQGCALCGRRREGENIAWLLSGMVSKNLPSIPFLILRYHFPSIFFLV